MKKILSKTIAIILCTTTISFTTCPAYATSLTDYNKQSISKSNTLTISKIPKNHVYIPAETVLEVELTQTISSKTHKTDDPIKLKTLDNLIINGVIVIPKGSTVEGIITKSRKSGAFGRSGTIEFSIKSVETINSIEVPLEYKGKESAGNDDGAIAVFAAVSMLGGIFMKGKNVSCPAGTKMEAKVTTDTDLGVTFDKLAEAMNPNLPHGVTIVLPHST